MNILGAGLVSNENGGCLSNRTLSGQMRRADRFCKMAVSAAQDALEGQQAKIEAQNTGIILSTTFGPHPTTFKFLDNILDYKENEVSPTLFSHSVHNAAVSYVAAEFKINGPTLTLAGFDGVFVAALNLAHCWFEDGVCTYVLLGAVEERGPVFDKVFDIGEGSVFFLLSRKEGFCRLKLEGAQGAFPEQKRDGAVVAARALFDAMVKLKAGKAQEAECVIRDCQAHAVVIKLSQ